MAVHSVVSIPSPTIQTLWDTSASENLILIVTLFLSFFLQIYSTQSPQPGSIFYLEVDTAVSTNIIYQSEFVNEISHRGRRVLQVGHHLLPLLSFLRRRSDDFEKLPVGHQVVETLSSCIPGHFASAPSPLVQPHG